MKNDPPRTPVTNRSRRTPPPPPKKDTTRQQPGPEDRQEPPPPFNLKAPPVPPKSGIHMQVVKEKKTKVRTGAGELFHPPQAGPSGPVEHVVSEPQAQAPFALNQLLKNLSGQDLKIHLDDPRIMEALGQHAPALKTLLADVTQYVDANGSIEPRELSFRPSILLADDNHPAVLMGPTRSTGGIGKIRDGIIMMNGGQDPLPVVLKEWRTQQPSLTKMAADGSTVEKAPLNRLGIHRNALLSEDTSLVIDQIKQELESNTQLSGGIGCYGARQVNDKIYMAMGAMDLSMYDAVILLTKRPVDDAHYSSFVRHVAMTLAEHLTEIHRRGFIHIDGKLENTMLRLSDCHGAYIDFGSAKKISADGLYDNTDDHFMFTEMSPELVANQRLSPAHDVFLLGLTLLSALSLYKVSPPFERDQGLSIGVANPVILKANKKVVEEFTTYRRRLMLEQNEVSRTGSRIDMNRLQHMGRSEFAKAIQWAARMDQDLTAYIVEYMLNPDVVQRATAREVARDMATLAQDTLGNAGVALQRIETMTRQRRSVTDRLEKINQLLNQPSVDAFARPQDLAARQRPAE